MAAEEKLSLTTIKGGAAVEMFDLALDKTLANIGDINTTLDPRTITLELKIKPSDDRTLIGYEVRVKTKLAGQAVQGGSADLRIDGRGRHYGKDRIAAQMGFGFAQNVKSINGDK